MQCRARAGLASERNEAAGTFLAALKAERASLAAQSRRIETEAAPIRYVAELVGADTDSANGRSDGCSASWSCAATRSALP